VTHTDALFQRAAEVAAAYRGSITDRPVPADASEADLRAGFDLPLPDSGRPAADVLDELVAAADPGLVQTAGGRFFGFVIGGSYDVAVAAEMVTAGWDQCAYNHVLTPAGAVAEQVAGRWLTELLGLPADASVGFVTGGQEANTVGVAAGRHQVLADAGWDVEADGLAGAPRVRVVAGAERHATIDRALRLLGFGTKVVEVVAVDANGAIRPDELGRVLAAEPAGPTIVCLQAGNVNTGACDPLRAAITIAREHGAWVHVDGAFGLWAAASPRTRALVDGIELADSAYLTGSGGAESGMSDFTLESSRRARGFSTWALLRHLGRDGVAELVDHLCAMARRLADGLEAGGARIANEVVLNQVLVDFADDDGNLAIAQAVQQEGTCWLATTDWQGRRLLRLSVSSCATTEDDVDRSVESILAHAFPGPTRSSQGPRRRRDA
jgi:glutamate/tyrosine decarboxylase-like PLP-dependent enzyme